MSERSMFLHLPPPFLVRRSFVVPEGFGSGIDGEEATVDE
jgi:hypothetical protein